MTLRLRLTFWYSAVLTVIIFAFGMAVYGLVGLRLREQIDSHLSGTVAVIHDASRLRIGGVSELLLPELDAFGASRVYVQVWNPDGTLRASSAESPPGSARPLDAEALQRRDRGTHRDVYVNNVHIYVVTEPMRSADGQFLGHIQAAASLETADQTLNYLLLVLSMGGLGMVLVAGVLGWLAASRALQPLEAITQMALQITRADDLSRRIPLTGAPLDEVGRLAQAFNESLERLERLFNAQRRFLADVSHELRTPLTVIRGNVDLLRRMGGVDPTSLDAIQSESERMSRLVGDLLLLAQAEAGTLPMAREPVELDTLLLEIYRQSQVLAGGVQLTIGDIDQAMVLGDPDRLRQLLLNLVSNALKYTPEGGRVTLGLTCINDWARLVVSDTGIGIPPGELPFVFERFYRVDKARSRAQGGSGLGLAIAQRIAQMHGGRIEASSDGQAGRGSTFCVWLPLAPHKATPETRPAPALPAGPIKKAGS